MCLGRSARRKPPTCFNMLESLRYIGYECIGVLRSRFRSCRRRSVRCDFIALCSLRWTTSSYNMRPLAACYHIFASKLPRANLRGRKTASWGWGQKLSLLHLNHFLHPCHAHAWVAPATNVESISQGIQEHGALQNHMDRKPDFPSNRYPLSLRVRISYKITHSLSRSTFPTPPSPHPSQMPRNFATTPSGPICGDDGKRQRWQQRVVCECCRRGSPPEVPDVSVSVSGGGGNPGSSLALEVGGRRATAPRYAPRMTLVPP